MKLGYALLVCACVAATAAGQTPTDKAWAKLTTAAADKSAQKRARAIQALGLAVHSEKAVRIAEKALGDESEDVRASAATALGQIGSKGSAVKLKAAVRDQAAAVVFAAANALFVLQDPSAYEVYYAVLAGERKSGDSLMESQTKMLKDPKAVAKIGFEAGIGFVPFGGASYKAFQMMAKDDTSPVRAAAAQKLSRDPDPRTQTLLLNSVADKNWMVRAAAIDALAKRGSAEALPAIAAVLDDENEIVQLTAAAAVIRLSGTGAH